VPDLIGQPLTIGVYLQSSVVDGVFEKLELTLYGAAVVIFIAVILALVLGRRIGYPMHSLADATRRLAELDFGGAPTLSRSRFREIDVAANAYNSMRNGLGWFSTYVPQSLVPHLMSPTSSQVLASREVEVTVLFTDIVGFSGIAQRLSPRRLAAFLNRHFTLLGGHIAAEGGSIDKYIGDSIMAFWGAPEAQEDHALRAVRAAQRISARISARLTADNARRARKGLAPVRIRIGIHSGRAIAGNIGAPGRINYTLVGDTVNIAQRLEQFGKEVDDGTRSAIVSISADAAKLLPADVALTSLGKETLPGRNTETEIYRLE
jgi:adenylate cyclase